jgi:hypothetical protein
MTQHSKIIDITKSFKVIDPNAFAENLEFSTAEDTTEKGDPIQAYEGYNFLPTSYGYRSFFGTSSVLDIAALPSKCDRVILFQLSNYKNILIALCEDGIWYSSSTSITGATWTHGVVMAIPTVGTYKEFTFCVIENTLYFYREGEASYHKVKYTDYVMAGFAPNDTATLTFTSVVPTFLNMAGQKGIFRANMRLGFWDSANSISWSDIFDLSNFTPSIQTLAGNSTFSGISGRIVTCKSQGDNFVIYSTKGIVGVRYSNTAAMLWEANTISDSAGIWYDHEVSSGINENEHYAYTNTGIKHIGNYNVLNKTHVFEEILTDVYDLLRESRQPVYLDFINGRYLVFSLINADYINGKVSFVYNTIDSLLVRILVNNGTWNGITTLPINVNGRSITSDIAANLLTAATDGMYLHWTSTGEALHGNVGVTAGAISPLMPAYTVDAVGVHTPNTPISTATTISVIPTNAAGNVLGAIAEATQHPQAIWGYLGWTGGSSLATQSANLGVIDANLNDFLATQNAEWANFQVRQTANYNVLVAIPPYVAPAVLGATPYYSISAVNAAMAALVAANPAVTTTVGSILSGAGTAPVGVLSGVGTNNATYTRTMNFLGGWDIKKTVSRTYSARSQAPAVTIYGMTMTITSASYGGGAGVPVTPNIDQVLTQYNSNQTTLFNNILAAFTAVCPAATTSVGFIRDTFVGVVASGGYNTQALYGSQPTPTPGQVGYYGAGTTPSAVALEYYIDYVETTTLSLVANPTISYNSIVTAAQTNLTWGYFTPQQAQYGAVGTFTSTYGAINIPGTGILGTSNLPLDLNIVYPGATYLLQDGTSAPLYPTFSGALVFDTALKKWGKMKATYRTLLDYSPINTLSGTLNYTNFGMDMAMLEPVATGKIRTFDSRPTDSWMRYGKLGFYRQGFTQAQEVKCHFRSSSTGTIEVDSSLDGRSLELALVETYPFTSAASVTGYFGNSARWHTVKISGQFDLQYLEFRGNVAGRR